jgi:hypothetical protein
MPDWEKLVRDRLAGLALERQEQGAVIAELAGHLEESYMSFRREGLPEPEAFHRTINQVTDWRDLQHKITLAKKTEDPMRERLYQLWIPGFLTLTLSTIFLMTLQRQGFQSRSVSWIGPGTVLVYMPWLMSLPLFGALGTYLSSRVGGSRGTVLLASLFPVLAFTAAFLLMFPIGSIVERIIGRQVDFSLVATAILRDGIGWILLPGAALLAGGLLSQLLLSRRLDSRRIAGH